MISAGSISRRAISTIIRASRLVAHHFIKCIIAKVPFQSRKVTVPFQSRKVTVPRESRRVRVPFQSRKVKVQC